MKYLLAAILITGTVQAATLEITNKTGYEMRIVMLHNKCDIFEIPKDKPVYLQPNEAYKVAGLTPVVQSIDVCGVGICMMSAIGMKKDMVYKVDIVLDQGFIDYKATPDHWTGTNTKCPNEKK